MYFILSEVKYRIIRRHSPLSDVYFNNALFAFYTGVCLLYVEIYLKVIKIPRCIVRQHVHNHNKLYRSGLLHQLHIFL
jgi:hypothetical protein